MPSPDSRASLQGYFDDLLIEAVEEKPQVATAVREPESTRASGTRQPLRQSVAAQAPARTAIETAELEILEQTKREKLQALLNSQSLALATATVVAPAPEPSPEPATAEVSVEIPAPAQAPPEVIPSFDSQEVPVVAPAEPVQVETQAVEEASALSPFLAWHPNGRPEWAQNRFDALLFDVAGLTLAVPLIALGQIHPLTDELTPLFGQAKWLMGLLPTSIGNVRTVNTALFVMPERYDPAFAEAAKYVVSIDGVPWGLAVDAIHQPMSLDPDDVKWRTERSKRPWLAGTVKSAMCALLDIPQMGQLLAKADKNSSH